jgi:hypothetical protein
VEAIEEEAPAVDGEPEPAADVDRDEEPAPAKLVPGDAAARREARRQRRRTRPHGRAR